LYEQGIRANQWYPMCEGYILPVNRIIQQFCDNNVQGADHLGRFSAEKALTGIFKTFLMIASPAYMMHRAIRIFSTFYRPSDIEVGEKGKNHIFIHINSFDDINEALEYRIAGWVTKALEPAKCKDVNYTINQSLTTNHPFTEIEFTWK